MKKLSLTGLIKKLSEAIIRFPFVIAALIGLATMFYLEINVTEIELKIFWWIFFSLSILLQLSVTLWFENVKNSLFRIIPNVLAVLIMYLYVYLLPEKLLPYQEPQQFILGMLLVFSCFFVAYLKKNQDDAFWVFSKKTIIQGVTSAVFASILMGGLSLAAFSLDQLFGINITEKDYQNLSISCFVVFAPLYFLSNIPGKTEKYETEFDFNKVLKILGLYILLPVLMLYTFILYVYLIKIVIIWELPDGWVSTLVSVLGLAGFLCMMIVYPLSKTEQNKVVAFLSRYFPVILLPLLILMTVGIIRRLDDYGFTINRLYVLILNIWFYAICMYLFFTKSRHLKWIVITLVLTGLVFSVGPVSSYKINEKLMYRELNQLLTEAEIVNDNMISLDKINPKIDQDKKDRIYDLVSYVRNNYSNEFFRKYYDENIADSTISDLQVEFFNVDMKYESDKNFNHYKALSEDEYVFPIENYRFMLEISGSNYERNFEMQDGNLFVHLKDDQLIISKGIQKNIVNLQSVMKKLSVFSNDVPYTLNESSVIIGDHKMYVKKINFRQLKSSKEKYKLMYLEAVLLIK